MSYKKPEMEVIRFESADIVAASGGPITKTITLAGHENKDGSDNEFTFNGNTYINVTGSMKSDLADYFGDSNLSTATNGSIYFGIYTLNSLNNSTSIRDGADGEYKYDGNLRFTKKA